MKKKTVFWYTAEFLIIAIVLLGSFKSFSLVKADDGFNQFYPAFVYCGKYIRELVKSFLGGNFVIPQFDFSIGMGEGIIPVLNYYGFGDPFMLVSAVTPIKYAAYGYTAAILLKMYVSGFCFHYYCKNRGISEKAILAGLPLYIASNYLFYFCFQYPPYQSVLISLPLVCAGIDKAVKNEDKKRKLSVTLAAGVAFQALYGFYLLYMELLFAAVYALTVILTGMKSFKKILYKIGNLFLNVLLGLAAGGILFVPSVLGYMDSSRGGDFTWLGWDVLLKMTKEQYFETLATIVVPMNFSGVGLMLPAMCILAVCVALKKGIRCRDLKISFFILLAAYINMRLSAYVACGFTSDLYSNRWIFTLMFMAAVLVSLGCEKAEEITPKGWTVFALIHVLYSIGIVLLEQYCFKTPLKEQHVKSFILYTLFALLGACFCAIAAKKNKNKLVRYAVTGSILLGVILNIYTIFGLGGVWNFKPYEAVRNEILGSNLQKYKAGEGFARLDIRGNSRNEALYGRQYGVGEYFSMVNGNIYNFYRQYAVTKGMNGTSYYLTGLDSRNGMEDLISAAYYDGVKKDMIVENEDYLPLGFTFDTYISEKDAEKMSMIEKNARILETVILETDIEGIGKACVLESSEKLWKEERCDVNRSGVKTISSEEGTDKIQVNEESKIILTVDSETQGEGYFYTDQFKLLHSPQSTGHVYFQGTESIFRNTAAQMSIEKQPGMFSLGKIEKGKNTFEIGFGEESLYYLGDIQVYVINEAEVKKQNENRRKEVLQNVRIENNAVRGSIETDQTKILFLSVPYSAGWKAYVNGEKVSILKADYGFSGILLEAGENKVVLKYTTPGLRAGSICSIVSCVIMLSVLAYRKREKKQEVDRNCEWIGK